MEFDFLNQFHFLRPEWFIALAPLMLLVFLIRKTTAKQSGWQSVIPSHLYQYMVIGKTEMGAKPPMWMLAFVWIISVIALAGPTAAAGLPVENGTRYSHRYVAFNARYRYDARQANSR